MEEMRTEGIERKQWIVKVINLFVIGWMFISFSASSFAAGGVSSEACSDGIAQTAYSPDNNKPGLVVIVLSGQMGPDSYQFYAAELARLGYYVILVAGKDILNPEQTGAANLTKTIERALRSPNAVKGKVAVVGFSLGGGGALFHAANMLSASIPPPILSKKPRLLL